MLVVAVVYSLILLPSIVMAPFALGPVFWCKNQILPSGPAVIPPGLDDVAALNLGMGNSVNVTSGPFTRLTGALGTGPMPPVPDIVPPAPPVVTPPVLAPPLPLPVTAPLPVTEPPPVTALPLVVPLLPPAPVVVPLLPGFPVPTGPLPVLPAAPLPCPSVD